MGGNKLENNSAFNLMEEPVIFGLTFIALVPVFALVYCVIGGRILSVILQALSIFFTSALLQLQLWVMAMFRQKPSLRGR